MKIGDKLSGLIKIDDSGVVCTHFEDGRPVFSTEPGVSCLSRRVLLIGNAVFRPRPGVIIEHCTIWLDGNDDGQPLGIVDLFDWTDDDLQRFHHNQMTPVLEGLSEPNTGGF